MSRRVAARGSVLTSLHPCHARYQPRRTMQHVVATYILRPFSSEINVLAAAKALRSSTLSL